MRGHLGSADRPRPHPGLRSVGEASSRGSRSCRGDRARSPGMPTPADPDSARAMAANETFMPGAPTTRTSLSTSSRSRSAASSMREGGLDLIRHLSRRDLDGEPAVTAMRFAIVESPNGKVAGVGGLHAHVLDANAKRIGGGDLREDRRVASPCSPRPSRRRPCRWALRERMRLEDREYGILDAGGDAQTSQHAARLRVGAALLENRQRRSCPEQGPAPRDSRRCRRRRASRRASCRRQSGRRTGTAANHSRRNAETRATRSARRSSTKSRVGATGRTGEVGTMLVRTTSSDMSKASERIDRGRRAPSPAGSGP